MDKRSPDDIRKSIKSLVEEAENVSIDDNKIENEDALSAKEKNLNQVSPSNLEDKYKPESKTKVESQEKDLDLTGLISDDVALAVEQS